MDNTIVITEEFVKSLVGMDRDAAIETVQKNGLKARIRTVDGLGRMATMDFRRDRINFDLVQNRVTRAYVG